MADRLPTPTPFTRMPPVWVIPHPKEGWRDRCHDNLEALVTTLAGCFITLMVVAFFMFL